MMMMTMMRMIDEYVYSAQSKDWTFRAGHIALLGLGLGLGGKRTLTNSLLLLLNRWSLITEYTR